MLTDVGTMYRALRRLENEGKVTSSWETEGTGTAKRVYEVTEQGRGALEKWVRSNT